MTLDVQYLTYTNNSCVVEKTKLLIAAVIAKFKEKLSKYECDKNCRSKSHFSTVGNFKLLKCNPIRELNYKIN